MIFRARIVLPISRPPIDKGAVEISGGRIVFVGSWDEITSRHDVVDLGESILLPGLVNAHCHLDYTGLEGKIPPGAPFPDWIKLLIGLKNSWTEDDYRRSWLEGARMLAETGTTTVADIETVPAVLKDTLPIIPLRVYTFLEVLGPRNGPLSPDEILRQALGAVPFPEAIHRQTALEDRRAPYAVGGVNPGWRFGLSPHAAYSTTPGLMEACRKAAAVNGWRTTSHVSESEAEFEMFMHGRGPMYDWLKGQRDMGDCGHGSPLRCYERSGLIGESFLAVHMNYLWHDDAGILGRHRASVAHCPRSHRFFRHRSFPRRALEEAGVNICLGTDSLASVEEPREGLTELSMFTEMRTMASWDTMISAEDILRMATINGAKALGLGGLIGEITPGGFADLIAIPCGEKSMAAYEAVVHHPGPVLGAMVGGRWVVPPLTEAGDPRAPLWAGAGGP